jgi:hypothetical protein
MTEGRLEVENPREREPASFDVFPIFAIDADRQATDFLGTGFVPASRLFLTCWHLVSGAIEAGLDVVAAASAPPDRKVALRLEDLGQDEDGRDLASAQVRGHPRLGFTLATTDVSYGESVWTYGYPLTSPPDEQNRSFRLNGRMLQGYVTRLFDFEDPRFGSNLTLELDMRAPAGLSGAPLVRRNTRELVGLVRGRTEVELIERLSTRDPGTGERTPEELIVEYFALANPLSAIRAHRSRATGGRELGDLLPRPAT